MEAGFKVGDKCTIRQWEDMEAEFGSSPFINDYHRRINTPDYLFVPAMRPLCGRKFTISAIEMRDGVAIYSSEEHVEDDGNPWVITSDMLTLDCSHEDEDAFEPAGIETLLEFLRG